MIRTLLVSVFLLYGLNLQAGELPPAFKAQYVVRKGPLELGRATHELRYGDNGELVFLSRSDTTGLADLLVSDHIRETTRLKHNADHLLPLEYHYQRKGKRSRTISQRFDWTKNTVSSDIDRQHYDIPLVPGTMDQSAYQVSLMTDLAAGERDFNYHVVGKNDISTWAIKHVGDEVVDTVLGKLDTVVIQRNDRQITTMWCAPRLHFLPVKIQHEENGGVFTAYLDSVEGLKLAPEQTQTATTSP
jgi:hypothetical protein